MSRKAKEKISHKEKIIERRDKFSIHDFSSERATIEEVFDQATLMILYKLLNKGTLNELNGVVNAGKEARVYWGKTRDNKDLAVKIYLTSSAEFKKGMMMYIQGDYRFRGVKRDTRSIIYTWAQKEFRNLQEATKAKVPAPTPIAVEGNIVVMEFLGKNGINTPTLKEQQPNNPERTYKLLTTYIKRLYQKAELIHGDLSEYNLTIWKRKLFMFDMSQSVPTTHPLALTLLNRDIKNINRYFKRIGVNVLSDEQIYKMVTKKNV